MKQNIGFIITQDFMHYVASRGLTDDELDSVKVNSFMHKSGLRKYVANITSLNITYNYSVVPNGDRTGFMFCFDGYYNDRLTN